MFGYMDGYEEMVLAYGARACIAWVTAVYQRLDAAIDHAKCAPPMHAPAAAGAPGLRILLLLRRSLLACAVGRMV